MLGHQIPKIVVDSLFANGGGYVCHRHGHLCTEGNGTQPVAYMSVQDDLMLTDVQRVEMNTKKLPYLLVTRDNKFIKTYIPDRYFEDSPYEGRLFIHGIFDCYTLLSDWWQREKKVNLPWNVQRPYGWWDAQQSLYLQHFKDYGFVQSKKLEVGDVMLFNLGCSVVNHAAIYMGDGLVLHHLGGRVSCIEPLNKSIQDHLYTTVKYVGGIQ